MKNQIKIFTSTIIFLCCLNFGTAQTASNQDCWTAVGNTGILDQHSKDAIKFGPKLGEGFATTNGGNGTPQIRDNGAIAYLSTTSKGTYHIRYAINQRFIFDGRTEIELKARYKVRSEDRVIINLNRYKLNSPPSPEKIETILTFNSDSFAENLEFQTQGIAVSNVKFDFVNFGYFVDVQLIVKSRSSTIGGVSQPMLGFGTAIGLVQICATSIIDVD